MNNRRLLTFLGSLLFALLPTLRASSPGETPSGLNAAEWSGIRAAVDAERHRIVQQAYLKPAAVGITQEEDVFGWSVAVSGDTVIVGAPFEDSSATGVNSTPNDTEGTDFNPGAAYVFVRVGGEWIQQAYLKASNPGMNDGFGTSVAISGDTVVVGANSESSKAAGINGDQADNSALYSGAAYVFVRNGTNWTQQAYLKASNTDSDDIFGTSVAIAENTIVVGGPGESSSATGVDGNQGDNSIRYAGAAYVFVRNGTTWKQQAYLKASNTEADRDAGTGFGFGTSVAIVGETAVVGAPYESGSASGVSGNQPGSDSFRSGAAYVFIREGTTWTQQAYLKASNAGSFDYFGSSVAIGDNTVVVGAPGEASGARGVGGKQTDNSATSSGAVYAFVRNGTTWPQQTYLKASNTGVGDQFGYSVAISGDTVVVGARGEDSNTSGVNGNQANNSGFDSGSAYVFVRRGPFWKQNAYLKASNAGAFDTFGQVVAISDHTVVVGAYTEDSNTAGVNSTPNDTGGIAFNSGAAYIFGLGGPEIRVEQPAGGGLSDGASSARFGAVSVGGSADLVFTIRNTGTTNLTGLGLTIDGADANQFRVTADPVEPVVPGGSALTHG